MKNVIRTALAASAGLACHLASAQSNVAVYGLVDVGVEYVTHVNAAGASATKMPSLTGTMPSRIGFRGTEDLGNGLKALFVLENGFGPDTGMQGQGGRLFGRNAYVGLQGAWGTLTLGRQVNMTYIAGLKSDVMGPHVYAVSNLDPYLPNARSDNAIGYTGKFSDFTVGATYSFGRDASAAGGPASTNCAGEVPHNAKACRQFTTMLDYDNKSWGMAGSYDRLYGNAGVIFGGLTSSNYYDQRIALNGFFMLDKTKFGAGLIQRTTHTASDVKSNLYYAGSSTPFAGNWVLDAQASHLDVKDSPNDTTLLAARVMYNLSRRTAVYATVGHVRNRGTAAVAVDAGGTIGAGMSQSGIMTGVRHFF